ncbi:MAG: hypothetical protein U0234_17940 [Sandaracinus sp.]
MSNLDAYCDALVHETADYRHGELTIDRAHARRWVDQFAENEREFVAWQTAEIMKHWYATRADMQRLPTTLAESTSFTGGKPPAEFWKAANVLALQERGSSQAEVLTVFDQVLAKTYGFRIADCGSSDGPCVYVDDCIFSGTQVRNDLRRWIEEKDIRGRKIIVVTLGCHAGGLWHIESKLTDVLAPRGNSLDFFAAVTIEDRKSKLNQCEVLHPTLPDPADPLIDGFAKILEAKGHPPAWRPSNAKLPKGFASEDARSAYERIMLRKGIELRALSASPSDSMKPLGYTRLWTFGFGGLFTTYRNCANNAPLAWWWGDPGADHGPLSKWYPLLPRKRPELSIVEMFRGLGLR